ncbi:MAG TPA: ribonuclease HII [Opitutaceae bacterium]|nr:ribonuclease HII [Opitutaceae bacterium]
MPKRRQLRGFDLRQITGFESIIGVDEAGRGAIAGPVVAAAVRVGRPFLEGRWAVNKTYRVNDSKQMAPDVRATVFEEMQELMTAGELTFAVGRADVGEIESLNILGATKLAMRRALEQIVPPEAFVVRREPDLFATPEEIAQFQPATLSRVMIDGVKLKSFPYPHEGIVHGDARSLCIAMASIAAKVTRDRMLDELDTEYPGYGFARHKGYGTEDHRAALIASGRCFQHRDTFLRTFLSRKGRDIEGQMNLFGELDIGG